MLANRLWQFFLPFFAAVAIFVVATPAQAQLASGCSCPAGFAPLSSTVCSRVSPPATAAAICPFHNLGQIAASQQQQSFWGIEQVLQQKRDRLQSTPLAGQSGTAITGYANSTLDANASNGAGQKANPLATGLFDEANAGAMNPTYGAWVQGLGDWEHDDPLSATDIGHLTSTYTAQGGFDRTKVGVLSGDDALVLGLVSSWTNAHTIYDGSPTTMNLSGPGVGVYTEYVRGGFSTDLTGKFDFLQLVQDFAGTAPNLSINVLNAGLSGNAQYKVTGFLYKDANFIEPTVGFSLTHTSFENGAALGLEDAYTLRLQAGARIGTTWDVENGVTIDSSLKALVYGDAVAQGTSIIPATTTIFAPSSLAPSDTGLVHLELDPELCFNLPANYSVTVSGQFRYGQTVMGGSAGVNLRKQW